MKPARAIRPEFYRRGFALVAILLVSALLIGVGGTIAYFKLSAKPAPESSPAIISQSPNSQIAQSPAPDETVNWKTYENKKFGFSIKYPDEWIIYDDNVPACKGKLENWVFINKNKIEECGILGDYIPADFYISVSNSDGNKILKPFDEIHQEVMISGEKGILNIYNEKSQGPRRIDSIVVVNHNDYQFRLSYPNTDLKGNHEGIYDQILSTFHFLN